MNIQLLHFIYSLIKSFTKVVKTNNTVVQGEPKFVCRYLILPTVEFCGGGGGGG